MDTINNSLLRAVLWDMDGVLVDSASYHYQAWVGSDEFGYFKLDFWLGQSSSYIHQLQDTTVIYDDDDPDELDDNVAFLYRFDAFEGGQKVYRPAGAIPSDEDPGVLRSPVRAGGLLGTLDRLGRLAVR